MKKAVMTREELDERILNRIPHSGSHHYDGLLFAASLLAFRRKRKIRRLEKLEKLKYRIEQNDTDAKIESPELHRFNKVEVNSK